MSDVLRIAMWSGPRNVSTALMRAFGARDDTLVCDEPLYAHYLRSTGLPHPGADEIVRTHESDWRVVAAWLTGPLPDGARVFYQKHMAHHLLPEVGREWLAGLSHAFLIREPSAMLTSLVEVLPEPRLEDTGLPQQVELFDTLRRAGLDPPVVCGRELLLDPEGVLRQLCARLDLAFQPTMLRWEPGPRPTDGCWGRFWYASTWASTGFAPYREKAVPVPERLRDVLARADALYATLHAHRLRARPDVVAAAQDTAAPGLHDPSRPPS
ncbi:MAG: HAD family hydrolase [Planctomycetes bacterium]|nr:HAD family hydrolase [Planctomycetota bacterium]